MPTGGKFTLLPPLLLSLKPTKSCWTSSLSCGPSRGGRAVFGSYRSRAQRTERLLSSTPATMSSTASQSSLLRMLPVLSDKLSVPPTPKGASDFSSVGEESYQIEKNSELWSWGKKKINGTWAKFSKGPRAAHPPKSDGSVARTRAVAAQHIWTGDGTTWHNEMLAPGLRSRQRTVAPRVQYSVLTFLLCFVWVVFLLLLKRKYAVKENSERQMLEYSAQSVDALNHNFKLT